MSAYKKSLGEDTSMTYDRLFISDFESTWQGIKEALKSFPIDVDNRDSGYIQTKWIDNTSERKFKESFGSADTFLKARFRFRVSASKGGAYNGRPVVKVRVQKEQVVEHDVLEGPKLSETDGIDEKTLLYRIGQIILIRQKLAVIEEEKAKKELQKGF